MEKQYTFKENGKVKRLSPSKHNVNKNLEKTLKNEFEEIKNNPKLMERTYTNNKVDFEQATIEKPNEKTISEQLDQVVQVDETQKNIWVLYSLIAKELKIDKKSDLKTIIEATVEHYEKHKKIMADYQEVMKKTST